MHDDHEHQTDSIHNAAQGDSNHVTNLLSPHSVRYERLNSTGIQSAGAGIVSASTPILSWEQQFGASPAAPAESAANPDYLSPASISELTRRHEDGQAWSVQELPADPTSPASVNFSSHRANLSRREAFLLRHYVNKIAPWIDACDLSLQFTLEVSKRALQKPIILYAILAVSSRHQAIIADHRDQHEADFYQSRCVNLVIEALSSVETTYDDNLLATVVLLRVYEEIEHSTDMHYHLRGMGRLLASIPEFAHSGGLAEAASWQALRYAVILHPSQSDMMSAKIRADLLFVISQTRYPSIIDEQSATQLRT